MFDPSYLEKLYPNYAVSITNETFLEEWVGEDDWKIVAFTRNKKQKNVLALAAEF